MATTNNFKAAVSCDCGRRPVAAKVKRGGWIVACPHPHCPMVSRGQTLGEAVELWNLYTQAPQYKEVKQ